MREVLTYVWCLARCVNVHVICFHLRIYLIHAMAQLYFEFRHDAPGRVLHITHLNSPVLTCTHLYTPSLMRPWPSFWQVPKKFLLLHILIRGHGWLSPSFLNPSILIQMLASKWLTICVKYEFLIELLREGRIYIEREGEETSKPTHLASNKQIYQSIILNVLFLIHDK